MKQSSVREKSSKKQRHRKSKAQPINKTSPFVDDGNPFDVQVKRQAKDLKYEESDESSDQSSVLSGQYGSKPSNKEQR